MRLSAYVVLMFCIGAVMYLLGYTPVMGPFAAKSGTSLTSLQYWVGDPVYNASSTPGGILLIVIAAAAVTLGLLAGFSSLYLIPIIIFATVAVNLFILPSSFFSIFPTPFDMLGFGLFNLLQVLAVLNFVRGGA